MERWISHIIELLDGQEKELGWRKGKKREEEERKETEDISKEELIKRIEGSRKGKKP